MYHRSLYDILMESGRHITQLTLEMQGEDELFASPLTLRAVEAQLLPRAADPFAAAGPAAQAAGVVRDRLLMRPG